MSPISDTVPISTSASTTDDGDKQVLAPGPKRGRRPLETPPPRSVTNHRRIQNRMAQRAYRQRKESGIDILKQKVTELEKSKEEICREFINFTTLILEQSSVRECPEVIEHIKQSTISLLCSAREIDENERMDDQDKEQTVPPGALEADVSADATPAVQTAQGFNFSMIDSTAQLDCASWLGPTTDSQPNTNSTPSLYDANSYFQMPANQMQYCNMNYQLPGATYDSSLRCPRSYAAQEATFGRRLHRASQEAGFLLASMKHAPPTWYRKVFGFCMHFETREEISSRMANMLRQSKDTTLNNWRYPFTNLGGAGLFYPQDQSYGFGELPIGNRSLHHEAYKPSEMSGFSMGPFGPSIEQVRDLRLNPQLRIIDPEYEGDFFDSDEVEICLRGYGVTIPPNKDFVTAHIDMAMFEKSQDVEPASHEPQNIDLATDLPATSISFDMPTRQDFEPHQPMSVHCPAGMMGMAMGKMPPPPRSLFLEEHWETPSARETKIKVDVEKLITCLVNSTVCLGRTPAVRPKDIRKALKASLVQED
ncbi:hypothetical protein BKA59DRAFT_556358 [Fusarium tricinctum]|uniref:BZIP domain-containing protein n=1 Tax=Fusarium tricinctum TaxID=61284 RepID=A0A8K0S081_9HYPO|nr:hypothetical protein BKA59DRAFT_556358 [Fusarium tricinctum]